MRARKTSDLGIKGINPYILEKQAAERLNKDWRRAMPVTLRVEGQSKQWWSTSLMPAGDVVAVELEFDRKYHPGPAHPMPPFFEEELRMNPQTERGWSVLIRQKEILRYLAGLKSPQAQERNIEKAIQVLAGTKLRLMARDWNGAAGRKLDRGNEAEEIACNSFLEFFVCCRGWLC